MKKVREVLRLHCRMNLSIRKINGATGVPRSTVQNYLARYKAAGIDINDVETLVEDDLDGIKARALYEGLPYQTLIGGDSQIFKKGSSALRKYSNFGVSISFVLS